MIIECLFPELCNLFADSSNIKFLKQCLPEAHFIHTEYMAEPAFLTQPVNMIYMGAMTEHTQELVIKKLMPYKEKIKELIENDVLFLITSNAIEIFGQYIENEDGSKIEALGIFDFSAKRDMMHRFNGLVKGKFNDIDIVGFKSQFTMAYNNETNKNFIQVERGVGMNPKDTNEGIHYHHFFGTYLIGPFLCLNPLFMKYLMSLLGVENPTLCYEDVVMSAYERRLEEFSNPKTQF